MPACKSILYTLAACQHTATKRAKQGPLFQICQWSRQKFQSTVKKCQRKNRFQNNTKWVDYDDDDIDDDDGQDAGSRGGEQQQQRDGGAGAGQR